jgi:hypothetical protein
MKKNKLVIDYDYDFQLTGIVSPLKGYKLAWEINHKLGINLVRQPDLVVGFKNQEEKYFAYYAYETRLNRLKLFKNKPIDYERGKYFLVPEFPRYDFIFLTSSDEVDFNTMVTQSLKTIPSVELLSPLPTATLKSKVNFIF